MTNDPEIKRTANGSIDTKYYIQHSHNLRSAAAYKAIDDIGQSLRARKSHVPHVIKVMVAAILLPLLSKS